MNKIDHLSYRCGVIDCFNEMIKVDVKKLALSHPLETKAEYQFLLPRIERICEVYGTHYYFDNALLKSSLFPIMPYPVFLFYKDKDVLLAYLQLKHLVQMYEQEHLYTKERQAEIAVCFAQLLSYPEHIYQRMIDENRKHNRNM